LSIRLIVNADDYGHTPGVSAGICDAHLRGMVTSTTAMMNMPDAEDALQRAMQTCPRLGLGVHLVLTTGVPLLVPAQVDTLIDSDQRFFDESELISNLSSLDLAQVRAEWRAQIERFITITGYPPDHLDSHHHISYLSPGIFQVMLELAQEYKCAIRFPTGASAVDMLSDFPLDYAQNCLERNLELVSEAQVPHPDYFLKSFYGENATSLALHDLLSDLPEGVTEIMCHPGFVDRELVSSSVYNLQREGELAILTEPEVLSSVKQKNIELVNFGVLKNV
jgi:chitin disaccharide deacetylase